jgi:hypothetical protein
VGLRGKREEVMIKARVGDSSAISPSFSLATAKTNLTLPLNMELGEGDGELVVSVYSIGEMGNMLVGEVRLSLRADLGSHAVEQDWHELRMPITPGATPRATSVRIHLGLQWVVRSCQNVARSVALAEAQLQETQRVLNIVRERMASEAQKQQEEEGALAHVRYKFCASSEFRFTLLDVKPSLSAFSELVRESHVGRGFAHGSVVCLVQCASVDFCACVPVASVETGELILTEAGGDAGDVIALVIPDVVLEREKEPKLLLTLFFLPTASLGSGAVQIGALEGSGAVLLGTATVPLQSQLVQPPPLTPHKTSSASLPTVRPSAPVFASEYDTTQLLTLRRASERRGLDSLYLRVRLVRRPALPFDQRPLHHMTVSVPSMGLSVIDRGPEELLYASFTDVVVTVGDSLSQQTLEARVGRMQVDDQRRRAMFPVVFQGPAPVLPGTAIVPFLQLGVNKSKMPEARRDVHVFQYVDLLLQEMSIKLDESLVFPVFKFFTQLEDAETALRASTDSAYLHARAKSASITMTLESVRKLPSPSAHNYFVTLLVLQPVVLSLTFQANVLMRSEQGGALSMAIPLADLIEIDRTQIRLNCLLIHNARGTGATLVQAIQQHYYTQAMKELYKLVCAPTDMLTLLTLLILLILLTLLTVLILLTLPTLLNLLTLLTLLVALQVGAVEFLGNPIG